MSGGAAKREVRLRLAARHGGERNEVTDLVVEQFAGGEWKPGEVRPGGPGFQMLVYALFSCQHLYMRVNAAERGRLLESSAGELRVTAARDWKIEQIEVSFHSRLRPRIDPPGEADLDYIRERMGHCPVSKNLKSGIDRKTTLEFEPGGEAG